MRQSMSYQTDEEYMKMLGMYRPYVLEEYYRVEGNCLFSSGRSRQTSLAF